MATMTRPDPEDTIFLETVRLSKQDIEQIQRAQKARLDAMSPQEQHDFYQNEEAQALREALSDILWYKC